MLNILTFNFHLLRKYIQMKMPIYKHDTYFWHGSYNSLPVPFRPLTGPYPESLAQHFVIFWSNPKTRFFWSFFFFNDQGTPRGEERNPWEWEGIENWTPVTGVEKNHVRTSKFYRSWSYRMVVFYREILPKMMMLKVIDWATERCHRKFWGW